MELELARAAGGDAFAGGGDIGIIGGSQSPPTGAGGSSMLSALVRGEPSLL